MCCEVLRYTANHIGDWIMGGIFIPCHLSLGVHVLLWDCGFR